MFLRPIGGAVPYFGDPDHPTRIERQDAVSRNRAMLEAYKRNAWGCREGPIVYVRPKGDGSVGVAFQSIEVFAPAGRAATIGEIESFMKAQLGKPGISAEDAAWYQNKLAEVDQQISLNVRDNADFDNGPNSRRFSFKGSNAAPAALTYNSAFGFGAEMTCYYNGVNAKVDFSGGMQGQTVAEYKEARAPYNLINGSRR